MTDTTGMNVNVQYDSNGNAIDGQAMFDGGEGGCRFVMDGGTAVITEVYPRSDYNFVRGADCVACMDVLEDMPFAQAVKFGEVDE